MSIGWPFIIIDMGLGKTLQSICILASDHYARSKKYSQVKSPDCAPCPSLVVCPPTLTGHWYHEILNYTDTLKPLLYSGNPKDRDRYYYYYGYLFIF